MSPSWSFRQPQSRDLSKAFFVQVHAATSPKKTGIEMESDGMIEERVEKGVFCHDGAPSYKMCRLRLSFG